MRDDRQGGREKAPCASVLAWRVRFGGGVMAAVLVMENQSTALVFLAALGVAFLVMAGGTAMAGLECRIHRLSGRRHER